jgi:hypothetical protein
LGFFTIVIYLKAYEHKDSKTEAEYINESNLSNKYDAVSNTSNVLVRTKLLNVDYKGWFVFPVPNQACFSKNLHKI